MTLGFQQKINGVPIHFMEKIWKGIEYIEITEGLVKATFDHGFDWKYFSTAHPKIHTIRTDKKDRWKVGMKIHPVINNRTKNRLQFAPTLEVKSIQNIEIKHHDELVQVSIDDKRSEVYFDQFNKVIEVYGFMHLDEFESESCLWLNDGFDSMASFLNYFKEDFTGKIIHWTDFKY